MELSIHKSLREKEQQILANWNSVAFSHANDDRLLEKTVGRFLNPIAYVIAENTGAILEWLIEAGDKTDLLTSLEEICRLKAVQDMKPSQALHFIFDLKPIIKEALMNEKQNYNWNTEMSELDKRIDEIALFAFDLYSDCRAQISELRINEIKRMVGRDAG